MVIIYGGGSNPDHRSSSGVIADGRGSGGLFTGKGPFNNYHISSDSFARKSTTGSGSSATAHIIQQPRYTLFSESTKARFFEDRNLLMESVNQIDGGVFWIDITSPSRDDLAACSTLLSGGPLHPLTVEDILEMDPREKCELFDHYLLVVVSIIMSPMVVDGGNGGGYYQQQQHYQSQQLDQQSTEISFVYIVIFERGIISLHSRPITHHLSRVLRRLDGGPVGFTITSDWILYALLDEFIDALIPLVKALEFEVDSIDDLVLLLSQADKSDMVRRIGVARKATTELHRILVPKRELFKSISLKLVAIPNKMVDLDNVYSKFFNPMATTSDEYHNFGDNGISSIASVSNTMPVRGTPKTLLYLRDAQDHVLSLSQSLEHFMDTLNTSHSNYLALISIELTDASNRMNEVVKRLTVSTVIFLPLTLLAGVMGMNVPLPLQPGVGFSELGPFSLIMTLMLLFFGGFAYVAWRSRIF